MKRLLFLSVLGLFVLSNLQAQILWYQDFSLPNGTTVDNGSTAWSTNLAFDCSGSVTGIFDVQGGQFVGNETDCNARGKANGSMFRPIHRLMSMPYWME